MNFQRKIYYSLAAVLCLAAAAQAGPYEAAAGRLAAGLPAKAKVAVLPFLYIGGEKGSRGAEVAAERITTELAGNKRVRLLERALLAKALAELKLQEGGLAGEEQAAQAGRLLSADYVVLGSLYKASDGGLELNLRAVETATGRIKTAAAALVEEDWLEGMPALPEGPLPENKLFKLCWDGLRALDRGDSAAATENFGKALKEDPTGACGVFSPGQAWRGRARARSNQGDLAGALKDLAAGLKASPGDPAVYALRGAVYAQAGRLKEALKDYDELVRLRPGEAEPLLRRGRARSLDDDLEGGVKDLGRAIELGAGGAETYSARGAMLVFLARFAEAEKDLDKAAALDPDLTDVYYARAQLYGRQRLMKKTLEAAQTLVELEPWRPQSYLERGACLAAMHRFDAALADFSKALELDPDYAKAYCYRGLLYRSRLRNEEALADFEKAIGIKPGYTDALMGRAQAYVDMGKFEEALKDVEETIAAEKPPKSDRYYSRAVLLGRLGRLEEAVKDLDHYIALVPDNPDAYGLRGYSYEKLGMADKAAADLRKLQELAGTKGRTAPGAKP